LLHNLFEPERDLRTIEDARRFTRIQVKREHGRLLDFRGSTNPHDAPYLNPPCG
jgi:hypothetical protein